jgi:hypothetical protein
MVKNKKENSVLLWAQASEFGGQKNSRVSVIYCMANMQGHKKI